MSKVSSGEEEDEIGESGFAIHALFASRLMCMIERKLESEPWIVLRVKFKENFPDDETKEPVELRVSPCFNVLVALCQVHRDAKMINIMKHFIIQPAAMRMTKRPDCLDDHENSSFET